MKDAANRGTHMRRTIAAIGSLLFVLTALLGCGDDGEGFEQVEYDIVTSEPRFVVPAANLPPEVEVFASNNNVEILFHRGRLFMAWRSAPTHFAGTGTHMYVVSSTDEGATWDFEHDVFLGTDMREPRLLEFDGELQLFFFQAGTNPTAFEPMRILRTRRLGARQWSALEALTEADEVPWDHKVRDGVIYLTSYEGGHYDPRDMGSIEVYFKESRDGTNYTHVGGRPYVYRGGVSETAFEFDTDGSLWIVTRNEDGDLTGFGSHLCTAPANALADWQCPARSSPHRYDSPEMFRHEGEIYLLARRDIGGPFDEGLTDLTFEQQKIRYLLDYSNRPKTSALYRIERQRREVVHELDLPGAGDTAFPSVQQTGPHTFLLANYTSPLDRPEITWLEGQTSERGTQLYLLTITFVPRRPGEPRQPTRTATPTFVPTPTPTLAVDPNSRVVLSPVFARPGVPLSVSWPPNAPNVPTLDLGDGTVIGSRTTSHDYATPGIFTVRDTVGGRTGAVARTEALAVTATGRFVLLFPENPLAQSILPGVIPTFYWAAAGDRFAIGIDPGGRANLDFARVVVGPLMPGDLTSFIGPVDLEVELTGLDGGASGQFVHLRNARLTAILLGDAFMGPIGMTADIVVEDVVAVLMRVGNFDRPAALDFVAGLFGFDPASPPETAEFRGQFPVN